MEMMFGNDANFFYIENVVNKEVYVKVSVCGLKGSRLTSRRNHDSDGFN